MADQNVAACRRWILVVAIAGCLSSVWPAAQPARAAELQQLDTSLKLIPEDAAFYSAMLRNREQIEAIAESRAWAKLKEMPVVKMGVALYQMQAFDPDNPVGNFQAALEDPDVRELIELVGDMVSDEIFCYGDASFVGFVELLQQTLGAVRYGPLVLQATGQTQGLDEDELLGALILSALSENADLVKIPNLVVGFKLCNTDRAVEQLKKLEELAGAELEADPVMQGRFKRTMVDGYEYLTLSLDGRMIPWDEVPLDEIKEVEPEEGDVDKLVERIKKLTLVIALGVREDYLLLSIGSSTDSLARLGKGKRLIDRPELKPLEEFAEKRLAAISYLGRPMMMRVANSKQNVDDLLEVVDEVLPEVDLQPDQKAQIRKDAAALAEDLKGLIPDPGPVTAISFLTEQGIEGYRYNWGDHSPWDGSKRLSLLEHIGGSPLLAVVGRGKHSPEHYELLVKWLEVAYRYFQQYAVPEMDYDDRQQFEQIVELAGPLLERLDKANRELLIPALADGQAGLLIDGKLTSKQFHQEIPPTDEPMPMIEPAMVIGVSNAELLRKACREYRAVADDLVDAIRQIEPGAIPDDYKIPDAEVTKSKAGTIYSWSLPEEWGLDRQIVPNFGLSETVAVLSISRDHTERLLRATPLSVGGVLVSADRPLAVAAFFDWAGLVDAVTAWVDLAVDKITEANPDNDFAQPAAIKAQVHTVLEVLKVLRSITSESYVQGDALVTHTLVEIRDVEE